MSDIWKRNWVCVTDMHTHTHTHTQVCLYMYLYNSFCFGFRVQRCWLNDAPKLWSLMHFSSWKHLCFATSMQLHWRYLLLIVNSPVTLLAIVVFIYSHLIIASMSLVLALFKVLFTFGHGITLKTGHRVTLWLYYIKNRSP